MTSAGPAPQPRVSRPVVRVRYAETDQMGVVYYANYLVWFEVGRDYAGKIEAGDIIVELPKDKDQRAKCFQITKEYYDEHDIGYDPADVTDSGQRYLDVTVR